MFEYLKIIKRLKEILKLKNNTELSSLFEVSTQTMGNWKSRNKIPYEEIFTLCVKNKIDINYILTGEKEQFFINFKEENLKIIENATEKEQEKIYHTLKSNINL